MLRKLGALPRRFVRKLRQLKLPPSSVELPPSSVELLQSQFDSAWYSLEYPNNYDDPPFEHYLRIGAHEGRSPNADFDELFYRDLYPDVAQSIAKGHTISGFEHFIRVGRKEKRLPRARHGAVIDYKKSYDLMRLFFDDAWYAKQYETEIDKAFTHYLSASRTSRHNPNPKFDELFYLAFYKDVREQVDKGRFLCGFEHYAISGRFEDRVPRHDVEKTLQIRMPYVLNPVGFDLASRIGRRLKVIPSISITRPEAVLWFLVPTLNPDIVFGGYRSALEFAASLQEFRTPHNFCDLRRPEYRPRLCGVGASTAQSPPRDLTIGYYQYSERKYTARNRSARSTLGLLCVGNAPSEQLGKAHEWKDWLSGARI